MSDSLHDRAARTAEEQAMDWFVLRDQGELSPQDEAEFESWLARDPLHRHAYGNAVRLWTDLGEVIRQSPEPRSRSGFARRWRGWLTFAPAAAAAALVLVCALVLFDVPIRLVSDARSATGEIITRTLSDGSIVTLNTDSAIAIRYTAARRRVSLLRGEVFIQVAHDPSRPFVVEAIGGETRALGTAFVVHRDHNRSVVTVLESRVAVAYPVGNHSPVTLSPGQRIRYDSETGIGPIEMVDAEAASAWRRGNLMVVDQSLGSVIEELNRYYQGSIRVIDSAISDRRVSGVFDLHQPITAVDALERSLGLRSTRITNALILLHR
ncbi:MAG: FecR family protein [Nitrospirota bacterium]